MVFYSQVICKLAKIEFSNHYLIKFTEHLSNISWQRIDIIEVGQAYLMTFSLQFIDCGHEISAGSAPADYKKIA